MQVIAVTNLSFILIPAIIVVFILWHWTADGKTSIYAIARMILQLCLIGYALTAIFETQSPALVLVILSIMLVIASWIALRPVSSQRTDLYIHALTATSLVNLMLLVLVTQGVLNSTPWYQPSIVIPLAGMLFANGMNAISIFIERYSSEVNNNQSKLSARNLAYSATMIPTINSLFAVGLVSLPGMMTGQILSGISPLIAVRYQIMVMLMLFASSGLTTALFYRLIYKKY